MGMLDWLLGKAVEAPGITLNRAAGYGSYDPGETDYRCTDFSDYLNERDKRIKAAVERLQESYKNAEERARTVCERYIADLEARTTRLADAEKAFMARRAVVLAALRDSSNSALAGVIARETMVVADEPAI